MTLDLREYGEHRPDFETYWEDEEAEENRRRRQIWRRRLIRRGRAFLIGVVVGTATSYIGDALWDRLPLPPERTPAPVVRTIELADLNESIYVMLLL